MNDKYENDIKDYPKFHNLDVPEFQDEYRTLHKHKSMITEELYNRIMDMDASPTLNETTEYFDSQTGCVLDKYGKTIYSVAYSENEDEIIYTHSMNEADMPIEYDDESDYEYYKYHDRTEMYRLWNYTEQIDEEE